MTLAEDLARAGTFSEQLLHRLVTVLDALDYDIPVPLWDAASKTPQPTGGKLPPTGVLTELQEKSKASAVSETIALVLQAFGSERADAVNLLTLGDAIRALRAIGLEDEARRLGFEALYLTGRVGRGLNGMTDTAIQQFLDMLSAERGSAANTLDAYRRDLTEFARPCMRSGKSVADAGRGDIEAIWRILRCRASRRHPRAKTLSAAPTLQVPRSRGHDRRKPDRPASGPKQAQALPKILSVAEVDRLIETARRIALQSKSSSDALQAARLYCLVELLYATGLRVSELIALPRRVIETDERLIPSRARAGASALCHRTRRRSWR